MSVFWAYTLVVSIWSKLCSLLAFDKDLSFESGSHWLKSRVSWLGACWSLKILDSAVFFFKKVILFWKDFFFFILQMCCKKQNKSNWTCTQKDLCFVCKCLHWLVWMIKLCWYFGWGYLLAFSLASFLSSDWCSCQRKGPVLLFLRNGCLVL